MRNRILKTLIVLVAVLTAVAPVLAHTEQDQGYYGPGMMWSDGGSWMHHGAHMAGYNMWGMGYVGMFVGLLFWALAILGAVYLFKLLTGRNTKTDA